MGVRMVTIKWDTPVPDWLENFANDVTTAAERLGTEEKAVVCINVFPVGVPPNRCVSLSFVGYYNFAGKIPLDFRGTEMEIIIKS